MVHAEGWQAGEESIMALRSHTQQAYNEKRTHIQHKQQKAHTQGSNKKVMAHLAKVRGKCPEMVLTCR